MISGCDYDAPVNDEEIGEILNIGPNEEIVTIQGSIEEENEILNDV